MKKLLCTICLLSIISVGGCRKTKTLQEEYDNYEKLLYEKIVKLVEVNKTSKSRITFNFSIGDLGMTKGQVIKTFGFPDHVYYTYRKGLFWGTYKYTCWEYSGSIRLHFDDGVLTSWQDCEVTQ